MGETIDRIDPDAEPDAPLGQGTPPPAYQAAQDAAQAAGPIPASSLLHGVPGAADAAAIPASTQGTDPWAQVFASPDANDPWAKVFQPEEPSWWDRQVASQVQAAHQRTQATRNIGNAFIEGLGDGWTGAAIMPPNQPWGMSKEMSEGLDRWLSYSKVKEQEQTALQHFNEGFLFPVVRALANDSVAQYQLLGMALQPPLQAGSALLEGTLRSIIQLGDETGQQALARDIAADVQRRAIGGGEPIGIPEAPVARPTPEAAIAELRREPFPEAVAPETFGPREAPVIITPDVITQARQLGVLGTREEWDGTSVYAETPPAPEAAPPSIHEIARQVNPETFQEYDRLSTMRDNARQQLNDEVERLRTNAEDEIERNAPHTDEIADLQDTLADPRSSARSKRNAEARLPGLRAEQEAYLADQDRYAFLTRETPEITDLRREVMANDERMRDLAPQVSAAYREAATRMPPEPEAAEPVAAEPISAPPPEPTTIADIEAPAPVSAPPLDIAAHVADRLTAAGRPPEEGQALGALVQAYYETKAQRFGGNKGTAADLYRAEAPQIVGRGSRGTAAGSMEMVNGRSVLTLFNRADATTAIHEFGHQWFNDMLRDAQDRAAPANLRVDAALVRRWLGVEEGQPLTRRHQERVARAFENYMMEGHAPSAGLARVFEQFRDWMVKVYQTVKQQNVPLNDDLRGVFDRWFASEPRPREAVTAPEKPGPPPKPRQVFEIMRDEHVRENVARQMQSQEVIAYADWQAANRNAGTLATPAPAAVEAEPGARPRTPRPIAQIIAEEKVSANRAAQIQGQEYVALSDWQAAQRAAGKPSVATERAPQVGSVTSEEAQRIARDMLAPKEAPSVPAPIEPVTATPPVAEVVAKNFGPEAKPPPPPADRRGAYQRVPKEPKRLIQFLKEGVTVDRGTPNEHVIMRGLMPEPNGRQQLQSVLGGAKNVINVRDGEPLDHARGRADEAGYFPQGAEDINALYEAMERDASGHAVYSMHDDDAVARYEQAVKHNREIDRLSAEHGIDPRGMTLQAFTKAIEDKVGREEFDAQSMIERAAAMDHASEMFDDLRPWRDNEAEHAGRIDDAEFERLWGEASASQELVDRGPGAGEPGVSAGPAEPGAEGAGSERGSTGVPGPAAGEGAGRAEPTPDAGSAAGEPAAKPEPFPVTKPSPGLAEQIKRRREEVPKIGNIRLEYILDGKWDELVAEVMSELSLSGDPRVRAGSVRTMAEHVIFNEASDQWYKAKEAWQANPSETNWAAAQTAKANLAATTAQWSTGLTNWAYTGHTYQAIIRANKRIEAEAAAMGTEMPTDPQVLFQRQKELELLDGMQTPEQVGHALMRDMTSRWDRAKNGLMAFYLSNILSGPVTHAGYLIGGFINNVVQPLLVIPAQAGVGAIRAAAGIGAADHVLIGEAPAFAYGLMNGAMKGVAPAIRAFWTGEVEFPGTGVARPYEQQILPTMLGGTLGYALETPLRAIRAIHLLNYSMRYTAEVSRMAYRDAMARIPEGASSTEFGAAMQRYINNIPEADMEYAHDEATRSALMKPPAPGSLQATVSRMLNQYPGLRLIAPFPQIGMNLIEEGIGRTTPLGLLSRNVRGDIAAGGARQDIVIGRMAAGSGIATGIAALTLNGLITGPGPDLSTQKGRDERALLGERYAPFSLKWGDTYIPLRKALGPLGVLVGLSSTLATAAKQGISGADWTGAKSIVQRGFAAAALDDTWLRSIHDAFEAATGSDQKLGYYLTNLAEGFIPLSQFLSQTARQIDPYVRQAGTFLEHVQSRIPFLSERLEPKIGEFGDPVTGHSSMGPHFATPDPVQDRMMALGIAPGPFPKDIKGVPLTDMQKVQLDTLAGHLEHQMLLPIVTAPGFAQLPAGMQIKQIDRRVTVARENAAKVVQASNPKLITDGVLLKQRIQLEGRAAALRAQ